MNIWQQSLRGFRNLFNSQSFEFEYLHCVRDWSGILCEPCGCGERGLGTGNGELEMGNGSGESEQRYSGKPDGLPERPH